MPKVRAVDEMNETELRAELVSLLADGVLRYMRSEQFRAVVFRISLFQRAVSRPRANRSSSSCLSCPFILSATLVTTSCISSGA
jgi:hypothetical protein